MRLNKKALEGLAKIEDELLELSTKQFSASFNEFERLHVQIMDKQRERREFLRRQKEEQVAEV